MKTKRFFTLAMSALLVLALLTGCGGSGSGGGNSSSDGPTIGFSVYDMQYEFFQIMERGTREQIEALGYNYLLHDQKSTETEMVNGAINLINQGIAALIISPCKPEALSSIVAAAKDKGIPVIVDDIGGGGADYDAIVISDCYHGGQLAADYTAELMSGKAGSKNVAIIKCEPEAVYAIRRGEGYKANITAAGYKVVAEISGHSKSEEGYTIMQDLLVSNPDLVAVFAENDPMAVGAANALADAGRSDIIVIGFNNDPEAQDAIKAGILDGTVAQYPDQMGKLTVDLAHTLIGGGTLTYDNADAREIYAPVALVKSTDLVSGVIGFSVYDMQYEFFQIMERGTREQIEALGYGYKLHDQKSSETEMVNGAINLINQGIAALIISPCKPEALSSIVAAAKDKGIPVIVDDIGGGGADYDAIVISDCYKGGQLAADYAAKLLRGKEGSKNVAIIKCEPEAVYAIRRGEGYKANITDAGFNVVAEISGHSKSEEGYTIMQDLLVSKPDLVAVFAENDPMAVGAANALADAGRDDIVLIGFNNDPEAQDAIKAGILAGTVAQYPDQMGKLTVDLANTLIKGGTLTYDNPDIREIFAEVKLITPADVN
ncbi:MAG: substrate-binding domain-containing protein [Clostridiales bacterium]|nr:substrate-binding domain-containing protein [Clostridiales bacterium]